MFQNIENCWNVADFRRVARRRLPAPMFHYLDGAADDELTLARNTSAFDELEWVPRCLEGVESVDMHTRVLGVDVDWPVLLGPTGMSRLFHRDGELAVAGAAAEMGTLYSLSTVATTSIEDIAASTTGPKMFQLYVVRDEGITNALIDRSRDAGFDAMCLTVDTVVPGNRERDYRTGMAQLPKFTPASALSFLLHPRWLYGNVSGGVPEMVNLAELLARHDPDEGSMGDYLNQQFDRSLKWADAERIRARWQGPFAIKGILSVEDARRAVDIGASCVIVSNHGGRQLDTVPAPIDLIAEIADAVGDKVEVILDGGVRRGTHVLKALSMGATACMIGRPYLYGLAAGGQAGVERVLTLLKKEIEIDMILSGVSELSQLSRDYLRWRPHA